ncbi:MAG: bifunctional transaldolase/phosoglucose isomerase [Sulfobacillus sp.]
MTSKSELGPVRQASALGQSIWYDNVRRALLTSGELARMVAEDGLGGVTSNPSIFEKAISGSQDYAKALVEARARGALDAKSLYEAVAFADIAETADLLRPVYDRTHGEDGYVSIEVPPNLAHDSAGTLAEAIRIWGAINRPNLMIKVPGTAEGLPVVQSLIGRGINVNITLLFSVAVYAQVAEAYLAGLEDRLAGGGKIDQIGSVASFFVSRIDSAVDARLPQKLQGKVAIANAKVAYQRYHQIFSGPRWQTLKKQGANPQRLLWASTSTKNPAYPELLYVESLIGQDTVNTVPPATYDAFKAGGKVGATLGEGLQAAEQVLAAAAKVGVDLQEVTDQLLVEGLESFDLAFRRLLAAVEATTSANPQATEGKRFLPPELSASVDQIIDQWREEGRVSRLWVHDQTLWTGQDEAHWLGWLGVALDQRAHHHHLSRWIDDVKEAGFQDAVVLGMGGSSLCPDMLAHTFRYGNHRPRLHVLDSTDPTQIRDLESTLDLAHTLFIVSSKSGSTLEPNIFADYFWDRMRTVVGAAQTGQHFVAITDPGSGLEQRAHHDQWRAVFHGVPSIGGRYSALSDFGMVPAVTMGVDALRLLERAETMAHACAACVPDHENPGLELGAILGAAAAAGRDKLTLVTAPDIAHFGGWLEQLLAESTGKQGKGLIPVDLEPLGEPETYGQDRLFVHICLADHPNADQDRQIDRLIQAGHAVYQINLHDPYGLGGEIFRWEFATAVAGSIIGIDPFNQPDVEDAKVAARKLADAYEQTGTLPQLTPVKTEGAFKLFTDAGNAKAVSGAGVPNSLAGTLKAHLARAKAGDYVALLAYIPMTAEHQAALTKIRTGIRDRQQVATCVGFGPRFQHSTGQAYKGGPNTGVFLQITCDDAQDLPVPGHRYSFGVIKEAQARSDLDVLAARGRRVLRLHLGPDVNSGLAELARMLA